MPGVYREKECPTCGIKHRKKGKYCCQSCSSKQLVHSQSAKDKVALSMIEQHKQPDRIQQFKLMRAGHSSNAEDFAIAIPDIHDLSDFDQFKDYDKGENW